MARARYTNHEILKRVLCTFPTAHPLNQSVEYSPSMLERVRPGAVSPDRALWLPTFIGGRINRQYTTTGLTFFTE